MSCGLAVRANLLCVTWSSARGHVFLFDVKARLPVSSWALPAPPGGYSDAAGVAMDDRFHLFVADPANHLVRHFSAFGVHLGDLGRPAEAGGAARRDRLGTLHRPMAVAVAGNSVWVAGGDQPRRRAVQRFSREGRALAALRSRGDPEGEFGAPRGLWADRDGVLVADTLHGAVQQFRRDGTFLANIGLANIGLANIGLPRRDGIARPVGVARGADGLLLVADAGDRPAVRALRPDGGSAPAGDLAARCEGPLGLTVDGSGAVYVLDQGGERVQRFRPDLSFESTIVDLSEHLVP